MWLLMAAILANAAEAPGLPEWMAGCWEQRSDERWTEECWSDPRGGTMIGYSRTGAGAVLTEWETMQIMVEETDDPAIPKMVFWGSPKGANRTMFVWMPGTETSVTFVNAGHDYPQRIRYWLDGRDLIAEIALQDGTKARRWRFTPKTD